MGHVCLLCVVCVTNKILRTNKELRERGRLVFKNICFGEFCGFYNPHFPFSFQKDRYKILFFFNLFIFSFLETLSAYLLFFVLFTLITLGSTSNIEMS